MEEGPRRERVCNEEAAGRLWNRFLPLLPLLYAGHATPPFPVASPRERRATGLMLLHLRLHCTPFISYGRSPNTRAPSPCSPSSASLLARVYLFLLFEIQSVAPISRFSVRFYIPCELLPASLPLSLSLFFLLEFLVPPPVSSGVHQADAFCIFCARLRSLEQVSSVFLGSA